MKHLDSEQRKLPALWAWHRIVWLCPQAEGSLRRPWARTGFLPMFLFNLIKSEEFLCPGAETA